MEKIENNLSVEDIQKMLRVLPNEAGAIDLEDLQEIFKNEL